MTAQPGGYGVRECESSSIEEVVVVGKQTVRQAARRAAFQVQARYRRERVERDRRLEKLAVEVLTALGQPCRIATGVCLTRDQLRLVLQPDDQLVKIKTVTAIDDQAMVSIPVYDKTFKADRSSTATASPGSNTDA